MSEMLEGTSAGLPGLPVGLDRGRHVERLSSPWPRRVAVVVCLALAILALLNTFGQVAVDRHADATAASLTVHSPERLRGGLIYTSIFTVAAHQPIKDMRLLLAPGWFAGVTFNGAAPQANQESTDKGGTSFEYGQMNPGDQTQIFVSWQMNPTTVGSRDQDISLYDGQSLILTIHRSAVVFP